MFAVSNTALYRLVQILIPPGLVRYPFGSHSDTVRDLQTHTERRSIKKLFPKILHCPLFPRRFSRFGTVPVNVYRENRIAKSTTNAKKTYLYVFIPSSRRTRTKNDEINRYRQRDLRLIIDDHTAGIIYSKFTVNGPGFACDDRRRVEMNAAFKTTTDPIYSCKTKKNYR